MLSDSGEILGTSNDEDSQLVVSSVLAVIATYNPTISVIDQVAVLAKSGCQVVIVDDNSCADGASRILEECSVRGATVLRKQKNAGIGSSLNMGLMYADEIGAGYVVTLDQDTRIPSNYVNECLAGYKTLASAGERVGAVTAGVMNGRERTPRTTSGVPRVAVAMDVMQSGMFFSLAVAHSVGGFRGDFIMDCVDTDFCLKLRKSGYGIYFLDSLSVGHELGHLRDVPLGVFGRAIGRSTVTVSDHSFVRRYYMSRNRAILLNEYFRDDRVWFAKAFRSFARETMAALAFEPRTIRRSMVVAKGTIDGVRGRTGQI